MVNLECTSTFRISHANVHEGWKIETAVASNPSLHTVVEDSLHFSDLATSNAFTISN